MNLINYSRFLTDYSIFHYLDNKRLTEEKEKNKNLNTTGKISKGVVCALRAFIASIGLIVTARCITQFLARKIDPSIQITKRPPQARPLTFIETVFMAPLLEEVLFRGIIQNGISLNQQTVQEWMPACVQKTRIFQWIVSPAARILGANTFFALAHLANLKTCYSKCDAIASISRGLIQARESILHETTGSIVAPIACHMTNNLVSYLIEHFLPYLLYPVLSYLYRARSV